jgi:hypothetical protein
VPKKKTGDDETPRRRGSAAGAAAAASERGLVLRVLLYSPKDLLAGLIAFAACSAIIANALFLQKGPHPAPIFGSALTPPNVLLMPNPLPRPRPLEADAEPKLNESRLFDPKPVEPPPEPRAAEQRSAEPRPVETRPVETRPAVQRQAEPKSSEPRAAEQRSTDPLANLVRATASTAVSSNVPRPPASIPSTGSIGAARRVAAVQRVLTEYGYAQLKPSGTVGPDTRAAIEKFERDRRLPVTGQVSDRLVRELYVATGHPVE